MLFILHSDVSRRAYLHWTKESVNLFSTFWLNVLNTVVASPSGHLLPGGVHCHCNKSVSESAHMQSLPDTLEPAMFVNNLHGGWEVFCLTYIPQRENKCGILLLIPRWQCPGWKRARHIANYQTPLLKKIQHAFLTTTIYWNKLQTGSLHSDHIPPVVAFRSHAASAVLGGEGKIPSLNSSQRETWTKSFWVTAQANTLTKSCSVVFNLLGILCFKPGNHKKLILRLRSWHELQGPKFCFGVCWK